MIKFVNAKLNLGLNIIKKRADGYHELETLFYPVGLFNGTPQNPEAFGDILEIHIKENPGEDIFRFYGNPIDCPLEKNLVFKAIKAFNEFVPEHSEKSLSVDVSLEKHIPDGAGLGGGSADASFTLTSLNELTGKPLDKEALKKIAAKLGADCPFFIENHPAIATGIGEILSPCEPVLSGYWAVIVKPSVYISTREAFAGITPSVTRKSIAEIIKNPIERWESEGLKNDFEPHIFKAYPVLKGIKERLKKSGALFASMSGSGSALFGIFPDKESALNAARLFTDPTYICLL